MNRDVDDSGAWNDALHHGSMKNLHNRCVNTTDVGVLVAWFIETSYASRSNSRAAEAPIFWLRWDPSSSGIAGSSSR